MLIKLAFLHTYQTYNGYTDNFFNGYIPNEVEKWALLECISIVLRLYLPIPLFRPKTFLTLLNFKNIRRSVIDLRVRLSGWEVLVIYLNHTINSFRNGCINMLLLLEWMTVHTFFFLQKSPLALVILWKML